MKAECNGIEGEKLSDMIGLEEKSSTQAKELHSSLLKKKDHKEMVSQNMPSKKL